MQVNDSVKVKSGEHEGRAGTITAAHEGGSFTVNLDQTPTQDHLSITVEADNLERLG